MAKGIYESGKYLAENPDWHVEDSPWKAKQIIKMMERNNLFPKAICEIGCGAGEILSQLQQNMPKDCDFYGYEISPQAFELSRSRANDKLHFKLVDFLKEKEVWFDVILLIDLIEHLEDYFKFMREIKMKSKFKLMHIPLDIFVSSVLRRKRIIDVMKKVGHIHYFTKELAIQMLEGLGYEILDFFYTAGAVELPAQSLKSYMARFPRRVLFAINQDLAVRLLGGYSLMVLAK